MGYFYAPDQPDESILGMCTNQNNSLLVTGDTTGHIKVWDILSYCIRFQDKGRIKSKPLLEAHWRAHDSAIVSVEFAKHDTGDYIISASTDKTARLWTLREGQYIGTFGQKRSWNLKEPTTWAHPRTPWTLNVDSSKKDTDSSTTVSDSKSQLTDGADLDLQPEGDKLHGNQPEKTRIKSPDLVLPPVETKTVETTDETFLGIRVEKELLRKQKDRKERRENFGDITLKKTQQYGKLCSPFQALSVPTVVDIKIPNNMPLSSRMISKGYTSQNLTEDMVMNMDFSYGGRDSPQGGDQVGEPVAPKKVVPGSKAGSREKESRSSMRSTPRVFAAPTLKKHHTVA